VVEEFLYQKFSDINVDDPFFDSLKVDYIEFTRWFFKKATEGESAYIQTRDNKIEGFLYLKLENGPITDINPEINVPRALKIGTLKINPHGTRLGERFIKKSIDYALSNGINTLYVTVFEKHTSLLDLFLRYGFKLYGGKESKNGTEQVLIKKLNKEYENIYLSYPKVNLNNSNMYLLAIYPEYHTRLFPDSKLITEPFDIVKDVSHTNSIRKVYISKIQATAALRKGDVIVIYRTKPKNDNGSAEYRSVATSICVVERVTAIKSFKTFGEFKDACKNYSVFTDVELDNIYRSNSPHYIIQMTYNVAFKKRIIRKYLADNCNIDRNLRWSFIKLSYDQMQNIIKLGEVNESYIIN
jgi:hypothetical protein